MPQDFERLLEQFTSPTPHRVDREQGIIFDVKILGNISKHGYRYTSAAIQEAKAAYEQRGCYIDHSYDESGGGERKVGDLFGRFESIRVTESEARGNLHYLKSHPLANQICEAAERMPENFGISHDAFGKKVMVDGELVVESIRGVNSIDIVTSPATNKGLYESISPRKKEPAMTAKVPVKSSIRKLLESAGKKGLTVLTRLKEADPTAVGVAAPTMLDAPVDVMPAESGEEQSPEDMLQDAIEAQICSIIRDSKLDVKGKMASIETILTAHATLSGGDKPAGDAPAGGGNDTPVTESIQYKQLESRLALLESQGKVRTLLATADVEATDELVEALALLPSDDKRNKVIATQPKRAASYSAYAPYGQSLGERPAESAPLKESTAPQPGSYGDEAAKLTNSLRL